MKLLVGDGRTLEVYDVTGPLVRFRAGRVPIRYHGRELVEDDKARAVVREVRDSDLYEREI